MIVKLKNCSSALTLSGLLLCGNVVQVKIVNAQAAPFTVAQSNQFEQYYGQMNQYSNSAYNEILPFLTALSQMETVETDEQLLTLVQRLNPLANRIATNFGQSYQTGEKMLPSLKANNPQTEYLHNVITLQGVGYNTFTSWVNIFNQILTAYQNQDSKLLQEVLGQFSPAVEQILSFANQTQGVINQGNQIIASINNNTVAQPPANITATDANPYAQMSKMMHQTSINILKNMGASGEWRYNPSTGNDDYYQF
ncbi:MAG: hypothetical protein IGQ45_14330 [Cyanobacterium sp. T60_A2020_053]|nr:hypothetical protein [Cyanobacterium sp. T60_A2020_053]